MKQPAQHYLPQLEMANNLDDAGSIPNSESSSPRGLGQGAIDHQQQIMMGTEVKELPDEQPNDNNEDMDDSQQEEEEEDSEFL